MFSIAVFLFLLFRLPTEVAISDSWVYVGLPLHRRSRKPRASVSSQARTLTPSRPDRWEFRYLERPLDQPSTPISNMRTRTRAARAESPERSLSVPRKLCITPSS
jgi:hypothetical protein